MPIFQLINLNCHVKCSLYSGEIELSFKTLRALIFLTAVAIMAKMGNTFGLLKLPFKITTITSNFYYQANEKNTDISRDNYDTR